MWFFFGNYKQYLAKVTRFLECYTMLFETKKNSPNFWKYVMVWRLEIIPQLGNPWRVPEGVEIFTIKWKCPPFLFSKIYAYFKYLKISVVGLFFINQYNLLKYERGIHHISINLLHCVPKSHLPSNIIDFHILILSNLHNAFNVGGNILKEIETWMQVTDFFLVQQSQFLCIFRSGFPTQWFFYQVESLRKMSEKSTGNLDDQCKRINMVRTDEIKGNRGEEEVLPPTPLENLTLIINQITTLSFIHFTTKIPKTNTQIPFSFLHTQKKHNHLASINGLKKSQEPPWGFLNVSIPYPIFIYICTPPISQLVVGMSYFSLNSSLISCETPVFSLSHSIFSLTHSPLFPLAPHTHFQIYFIPDW
ncbi:hypothetical protein VP01_2928g2 [Puccinia sorghi]|uniref:Uncharacterized protein n=1 Tax=Puccinia sorghi TaxID=27349 RepID=A0A0L6V1A4_9BASI|nr:hypothetical protein VP01_2928g2 [Puccinia sorghi]